MSKTQVRADDDTMSHWGARIVNKIIDLGLSSGYTNDIYFDFTGDVVGSLTHGQQLVRSDLDAGI